MYGHPAVFNALWICHRPGASPPARPLTPPPLPPSPPSPSPPPPPRYVDAALYLADLQAQGVIRQIGATNFDVPRLEAITGAGVRLASHQVRRGGGVRAGGVCAGAEV